uniref:Uncharacterized protein n=1 Tax=Panagrolaimus sp. JU765 TaxID=591449 RepID=A0AC34RNV3_9BILA
MTLNDNFHDKKLSLEHDGKYDGLLKLASPTSTSSTAPVSDVPKETQEQYINFGYSEDEWEKEHSAPNNLAMMATTPKVQMFDGQMEPPPTRVASQPTPLTPDEHDRPRFRLSISSQGSNEHTPPSKSR